MVQPDSVLSFPLHEFQRFAPAMWISPVTWLKPSPRPGTMGMGSESWLMRLKLFTFVSEVIQASNGGAIRKWHTFELK